MDNQAVVERIMKNLAFDLETVPKTKSVPGSSTSPSKIDPLNVKIRVRKKVTEPYNQGFISNNQSEPEMVLQKVRLVNSDETIMSFDMFMEAEYDKKTSRKPRKHIFDKLRPGLCLGAADDDDRPYMPETGKTIEGSPTSKSDGLLRQPFTISKNAYDTFGDRNITRRERNFLGKKCKPGGCLDPPFDEDRYSYKPHVEEPFIDEPKSIPKVRTSNIDTDTITDIRAPERKKKSKDISIKSIDTKVKQSGSISSIYKEESPKNSVITYPPDSKSITKTRVPSEDNKNKIRKSRPSNEDKPRQSINESINSFFSPPKGMKRDSSHYSQRDPSNRNSHSPKSIKNNPVEYLVPPVPVSVSLDSVPLERNESPEIIEDIKHKDSKMSDERINSEAIERKPDAPFILPVPLPIPIPFPVKSDRADKKVTSDDIDNMNPPVTNIKTNPNESVKIMNGTSPSINLIPFKIDSNTKPSTAIKKDILKPFKEKLDEIPKQTVIPKNNDKSIEKSPPPIYETDSNKNPQKEISKVDSKSEGNDQLLEPVEEKDKIKEQIGDEETSESNKGIKHDIMDSPIKIVPESTRTSIEQRVSQAIDKKTDITEVSKENDPNEVDDPYKIQAENQSPDVPKPSFKEGKCLINGADDMTLDISTEKDMPIDSNIKLILTEKDEFKEVLTKKDQTPKLSEINLPEVKPSITLKADFNENIEKDNIILLPETRDQSPKINKLGGKLTESLLNKESIEQHIKTKYQINQKTSALTQEQKIENLPEETSSIKELFDQALKADSILSEFNISTNNINKKTKRKSGDGDNDTLKTVKENRKKLNTAANTHYSRPFSPSSSEKSTKSKKTKSPDRSWPVYPIDMKIKDPKMTTKKTVNKSEIGSSIKENKLRSPDTSTVDISTVSLDFAFHSYLNSRNERILSTFDGKNEIKRYPNDAIILIKSQLKLHPNKNNYELSIPIDSKFDMAIEIKKTIERREVIPYKTETKPIPMSIQPDVSVKMRSRTSGSNQKVHLKNKESDKVCSTLVNIYEQELVPLQAIIRDLKQEIDSLAAQQTLFKKKVFCPKTTEMPRLIHSNKRCSS